MSGPDQTWFSIFPLYNGKVEIYTFSTKFFAVHLWVHMDFCNSSLGDAPPPILLSTIFTRNSSKKIEVLS